MEIHKTTSHFSYRIEQKPDGAYIARSNDPGMEPLEGATREEVLQKIQAKATAAVGADLSGSAFKFGGVSVNVTRKVNIATSPAISSTAGDAAQKALQDAERTFSSPVERSSDASGTMLRVLAALIGLAALLYFLLRR